MKRIITIVVVALLLMGITFYQDTIAKKEVVSATARVNYREIVRGKPVPGFELQGLDGKTYQMSGERKKPLIINFWASWCRPCHEEAPLLKRMYEQYGEKLDIYAVNVTKGDRLEDVKAFAQQYHLSFPVLLDHKGTVSDQFRILYVPTSFLVDKQGVLKDVIHVLPAEQLEQRIQMLINE